MGIEHLIAMSSIVALSIVVLITYFSVFNYLTSMYNLDFNSDTVYLKHLKVVSILIGLAYCIGLPTYVVLNNLDTRILFTLGLPITIALGLLLVCQFIILRVYNEHVKLHYVVSENATEPVTLDLKEDIDKLWTKTAREITMKFILFLCILIVFLFNEPNVVITMKLYYFMIGLLVYFHQTLTVFSLKESKTIAFMMNSRIEKDK